MLLFDAEESLARGQAEKALVSASKAMRERPESLTARSLFERARRELLRGRRKGKLEARLVEARSLLDAGDFGAAEKIVGAALKLVPDNAVALDLFGRLKERRLQSGTVEAEAERELDRLARERARRSADAARAALRAGAAPRALLAVRRALRLVPDDPDLLSVLAQVQESLETTEAGRAARRAVQGQVRRASELLRAGQLDDGLKMLRTVLYEDPDFGPAQDAIQEARRLWLADAAERAAPSAPAVKPSPVPAAEGATLAPVAARTAPSPAPMESPVRPPVRPPLARPAGEAVIPPEIRLPAGTRRATPWRLVLGGAAVIVVGTILLLGRVEHPATATAPGRANVTAPSTLAPSPARDETGPLAAVDPDLREAINAALAAYARALETADAQALQAARPDLSQEEREALLTPLRGALNVASDLRVLDVIRNGVDLVTVPVLRTVVVVGGRATSSPPVEETLRFERAGGTWVLKVPGR